VHADGTPRATVATLPQISPEDADWVNQMAIDVQAAKDALTAAMRQTSQEARSPEALAAIGVTVAAAPPVFNVGDRVNVRRKGSGTVRYVGPHHEDGTDRVGVELDEPRGPHNGTLKGHRYLTCEAKHGTPRKPATGTLVQTADAPPPPSPRKALAARIPATAHEAGSSNGAGEDVIGAHMAGMQNNGGDTRGLMVKTLSGSAIAHFEVGYRVTVRRKGSGTVRYVGPHHEDGTDRIGVELDEPRGPHNGTLKGHQYFTCEEKHGTLARPKNVSLYMASTEAGPIGAHGLVVDSTEHEVGYV